MPAFSRTLTSLSLDIPTNLIGKNRPTISDSDVPASHILLLTSKIRTMHESAKGKGIKLKFVLVDGFLLYVDREVVNKLDVRFLMKASFETLRRRREDRSGYVTDAGFWKDPPNYFAEIVYPAYLTFNRSALDTLEKAETHDRIEGLIGLDSEELDIASMVEAAVDRIVEHVENTVVDGGSEITA
ncbi:ribosylnicotinamide kinase [Rhizophlyctis rosea]|uniref:Ribosylnicotinamide kinase n=1 Tax=Rhizophlyctis rosea TaxID=64517 RepID=A0AAD5S4P1_9FUNG|nr:ribosylnicotinamide kinase [Rhizophlyctis rosea]